MDSSFQFALAGREADAKQQFEDNWKLFGQHLAGEQANVTVPGEAELVARLCELSEDYRRQADAFFAEFTADNRHDEYFGTSDSPVFSVISRR